MMSSINKILVRDFRNIALAELNFCSSINCICGANGQGKTNLLDAIHYLSMAKSSLGVADSFCVRCGCEGFALSGLYDMPDGGVSRFVAQYGPEGKLFKRDDKPYRRLSEHIGRLPVVMVSPVDAGLVVESGEERRRFANAVLSQMDVHYLIAVQRYNRLLAQRNAMLKNDRPDDSLLDVLEEQMARDAAFVCGERRKFAGALSEACALKYSLLSGAQENVSIKYRSDLPEGAEGEDAAYIFRGRRRRDLLVGYTTTGPQRDDFEFCIDSLPLRKCGSQGQQKSFLIAVKLSQFELMKRAGSSGPILLLDDLFDKLDGERTSRLLEMLDGSQYGQIFISDTSRERVEGITSKLGRNAAFFRAEKGVIEKE